MWVLRFCSCSVAEDSGLLDVMQCLWDVTQCLLDVTQCLLDVMQCLPASSFQCLKGTTFVTLTIRNYYVMLANKMHSL